MMISQGFWQRKGIWNRKISLKTAHFVPKAAQTVQNKAFQEKKYLTGNVEWLY